MHAKGQETFVSIHASSIHTCQRGRYTTAVKRPSSLSKGQKQSIPNISQPWLNHASLINLLIATPDPNVDTVFPLLTRLAQPIFSGQDGHDNDALYTPVFERINGRTRRRARGDDRITYDGQLWERLVGRGETMVRQIVVIFYGLERRFLAVEA
jgi:hypothetical protein